MNIDVFTDQLEYSRYSPDISTVTATLEITNPTDGATINVALFRLDGYGAVSTKPITISGGATQYQVTFDLNKDTIDTKGIFRAKQGDYEISVTDTAGTVLAQSNTFAVSIVPIIEIKTQWAKGVTFYDYEVLKPLAQPKVVTGVSIIDVPIEHFKGPFVLAYDATAKTLSWDGGAGVPVVGNAPQQLVLLNAKQNDYVVASVNPLKLPTGSANETIIIDNGRMSDQAMINQVRRATGWVQNRIISKIEPEIVDTETALFADEVAVPETYYRPRTYNKWLSFKLPYPNMLDVEKITGYFNISQVATIPREWYVWDEKTGIVELVPSTASQVIWSFYNGIFVMSYLFNYASIPSFWHYRMTVGLRTLHNELGEVVREAIAKKAVIELLNSAGTSYRAGYASQSTSRDGVSESEGYTSSAMYGTFGAHINMYQEWLKTEIPKIKKRAIGIQYTTI